MAYPRMARPTLTTHSTTRPKHSAPSTRAAVNAALAAAYSIVAAIAHLAATLAMLAATPTHPTTMPIRAAQYVPPIWGGRPPRCHQ